MTYTHSAPHGRRVPLLRAELPSDPADAHGPQDDARHTQAHLRRRQEQEAPQDLAAGAHRAAGIAPAPAGGESAPDGSDCDAASLPWLRACPGACATVGFRSEATGNAGSFVFLLLC